MLRLLQYGGTVLVRALCRARAQMHVRYVMLCVTVRRWEDGQRNLVVETNW